MNENKGKVTDPPWIIRFIYMNAASNIPMGMAVIKEAYEKHAEYFRDGQVSLTPFPIKARETDPAYEQPKVKKNALGFLDGLYKKNQKR